MAKFIIKGGKQLSGEVALAGAKMSAPKLMIASLLTDEPCVLENFPSIGDTSITAELLKNIGSEIEIVGSTAKIHTPNIKNNRVSELSRRNRIPILALGPLLARTGAAEVPILGGDKIGARPVDFHVKALEVLGADIKTTKTSYVATAKNGLIGGVINFDFPSVGATESAILGAVLAKGKTAIRNAALEPEIMSLVSMLQNMGAIIELGSERDIYVEGVERLRGVTHRVPPDRNEAVSFACLALATGGEILVRGAIQEHLITFLNTVRRMGAEYKVVSEGIVFTRGPNPLRSVYVETAPHPGFMTDWQQPIAVVMTQAAGTSMLHETVYEDRFAYAADLKRAGADVRIGTECPFGRWCRFARKKNNHVAEIHGPTKLHADGACTVRDLRSGMVDIIIALVAKGESEIEGVEEIDRGYEKIDERLRKLGADIRRE